MPEIDLSKFDKSGYRPGRSFPVQAAWFFFGLPILRSPLIPFSGLRVRLLRLFGARIGKGVLIKPGVRVKFPWRLSIGDHSWIGEDSWIDNLVEVRVGSHACLSQGAYLCTGNHDWSDPAFGFRLGTIEVGRGAWVCARSVVCPGVNIEEGAVLTAGSVAHRTIPAYQIFSGNPAIFVRTRTVKDQAPVPFSTPIAPKASLTH